MVSMSFRDFKNFDGFIGIGSGQNVIAFRNQICGNGHHHQKLVFDHKNGCHFSSRFGQDGITGPIHTNRGPGRMFRPFAGLTTNLMRPKGVACPRARGLPTRTESVQYRSYGALEFKLGRPADPSIEETIHCSEHCRSSLASSRASAPAHQAENSSVRSLPQLQRPNKRATPTRL